VYCLGAAQAALFCVSWLPPYFMSSNTASVSRGGMQDWEIPGLTTAKP